MPQIAASTARLRTSRSCGVVCATAAPATQDRASATNTDFLIVSLLKRWLPFAPQAKVRDACR
jgi:hypothetical protein